jgi:hypothetical protein
LRRILSSSGSLLLSIKLGASVSRRELKILCASFLFFFFSLHGVCFVGEEDSEDSEEGERRRR